MSFYAEEPTSSRAVLSARQRHLALGSLRAEAAGSIMSVREEIAALQAHAAELEATDASLATLEAKFAAVAAGRAPEPSEDERDTLDASFTRLVEQRLPPHPRAGLSASTLPSSHASPISHGASVHLQGGSMLHASGTEAGWELFPGAPFSPHFPSHSGAASGMVAQVVSRLKQVHARDRARLEADHREALARATASAVATADELNREVDRLGAELRLLQENHAEELERLGKEHEYALYVQRRDLSFEHRNEAEALRAELRALEELKDVVLEQDAALHAAREEAAVAIDALTAEHGAQLDALSEQHRKAIEEANREIRKTREVLAAVVEGRDFEVDESTLDTSSLTGRQGPAEGSTEPLGAPQQSRVHRPQQPHESAGSDQPSPAPTPREEPRSKVPVPAVRRSLESMPMIAVEPLAVNRVLPFEQGASSAAAAGQGRGAGALDRYTQANPRRHSESTASSVATSTAATSTAVTSTSGARSTTGASSTTGTSAAGTSAGSSSSTANVSTVTESRTGPGGSNLSGRYSAGSNRSIYTRALHEYLKKEKK